jgi:hypothetical protein
MAMFQGRPVTSFMEFYSFEHFLNIVNSILNVNKPASMALNTILQDVIAIIVCSDPIHNAKGALHKRLQSNGARVLARLGKDVTHIIFERRRSQRASDKRNEDEAVIELYRKLDGVSRRFYRLMLCFICSLSILHLDRRDQLIFPNSFDQLFSN